jgi:hypothetical protein
MPVQMIELEEVQMDVSDEALEAVVVGGCWGVTIIKPPC